MYVCPDLFSEETPWVKKQIVSDQTKFHGQKK